MKITVQDIHEIRAFLKHKGHAGLRDAELPIFLKHFLKGELGRNYEACWTKDKFGTFYEGVFTPDEFRDIESAMIWLDMCSQEAGQS